jgi:hypothetical protein
MSEQLAKLFHDTYIKLAPSFNKVAGVSWERLPERERVYRIAVSDIIELNYFGGAKETEDELSSEFYASSGYGHNTRKPFIDLSYNGRKLAQLSPESAIDLAHNLLSCAEASLGDAFLIEFMRERVGLEEPQIGGLLIEFREWREKREEEEGGAL